MKKITLLLSLMIIGFQTVAQVTVEGNTSVNSTTDYVGWDYLITNPLRIKHEANYGIEFYTNTGNGSFGTPKMMLNAAGYLGLGTGTTTPSSWLHIITSGSTLHEEPFRTAVAASTETNWRMYKGSNQMLRFYSPSSGDGIFMQVPRGDLKISSGHNGGLIESFMIKGGNGSDAGNVLVGNYSGSYDPTSKLHVKGSGYTSLLKIESDALSTPTYEILETEQHLFKARNDLGSAIPAFGFEFAPSTSVSDGIGMSTSVDADCTFDLYGSTVFNFNRNTGSSAGSIGFSVVSNTDGIGSYNEGVRVSCISPVGANIAGTFSANNISSGGYNIGVFADGSYSGISYGVFGRAFGDPNESPVQAIGTYGEAAGAPLNIGVYGISTESTTDTWDYFGLKGEAIDQGGISSSSSYYGVYGSV
jgi:hypothetical protein